jgi:hypothetical protein
VHAPLISSFGLSYARAGIMIDQLSRQSTNFEPLSQTFTGKS